MLACGVTNPPAAAIVVIFTTSPKALQLSLLTLILYPWPSPSQSYTLTLTRPPERQALYNPQRNSKIYSKVLQTERP